METLSLQDGGRLAYRDDGDGQPIVLVHGWGVNGAFFEAQRAALADDFRVVVPDLRGHGQSSPLPVGKGFEVLADDLQQLLGALDLSGAVIVGWSMGAMVAWDLVSRHGAGQVAGLVTVDMVPRILNDESWDFGLRRGRDASVFARSIRQMRENWKAFTRVFIPRIFAAGTDHRDDLGPLFGMAAENDAESMARLWSEMAVQDFRDRIPRIRIPVLVLNGERSQLYRPEASRWLVDTLPNGRRVAFSQSGHAPHLEEPAAFTAIVTEFVLEVGADRPQGPEVPDSSGNQSHDGGSSA